MNLIFDIGNTRTKCALFDEDKMVEFFAFPSINSTFESVGLAIQGRRIQKIAIVSVVPVQTKALQAYLQTVLNAPVFILDGLSKTPLENRYQHPQKLGADRIAGALGAFFRYKNRQPLVVIDAGTAVNIEVVFEDAYCGGAILPGLSLYQQSLARGTAQLPYFPLEFPASVIGNSTQTALQSGVTYGFIGSVKELLVQLQSAFSEPLCCIATGGDATFLAAALPQITLVAPHLVLEGANAWLNQQT